MKKVLFLLPFVLSSCIAKPIISDTACNDPEYLSLKAKPLDSMTDREFAYFETKDRECEQARANANAVQQLQHSPIAEEILSPTACNDSLYMILKREPMNTMTARQFAYYQLKDEECEGSRGAANAVKQLQTGQKETSAWLIVADVVLTGVLIAFATWNHN